MHQNNIHYKLQIHLHLLYLHFVILYLHLVYHGILHHLQKYKHFQGILRILKELVLHLEIQYIHELLYLYPQQSYLLLYFLQLNLVLHYLFSHFLLFFLSVLYFLLNLQKVLYDLFSLAHLIFHQISYDIFYIFDCYHTSTHRFFLNSLLNSFLIIDII